MFKKLNYKNPNKYLIKKKLFIRNFEELYKNIEDPWNQDRNFFEEESVLFSLNIINKICKNSSKKSLSLLDIGAGRGSLKSNLNKKIKYKGIDVHKKKYKNVEYGDITVFNSKLINKFDIIVCFKTIYYLGDKIDRVIKHIKQYMKNNSYLFISYNLKKNSFSNKYITDLKLRKKLKKLFFEIYTVEINRELQKTDNKEKNTLFVFKKS